MLADRGKHSLPVGEEQDVIDGVEYAANHVEPAVKCENRPYAAGKVRLEALSAAQSRAIWWKYPARTLRIVHQMPQH